MEEIIFLILICLTMLITYVFYKFLGKRGLYFSLVIMNILTFILSFKNIYLFKMNINLGIIPFVGIITILCIFEDKKYQKEIKNIISISFYSNLAIAILIYIMNFSISAITETISINMQATFETNYKILIIYPFLMTLTEFIISKLYKLIKNIEDNIPIDLILTYILTGLIYPVIFLLLSYIKVIEFKYSLFLGILTYIIGLPIALINIFFVIYLVRKKVLKWEI